MKLIIEVSRGPDEQRWDAREMRHETEVGWDANANDYVEALAAFMFARTFAPETIVDAFRDYIETWDMAHENEWGYEAKADEEGWGEEEMAAEADEKIAPVQDGEGGF